jgi:hypothetical protein
MKSIPPAALVRDGIPEAHHRLRWWILVVLFSPRSSAARAGPAYAGAGATANPRKKPRRMSQLGSRPPDWHDGGRPRRLRGPHLRPGAQLPEEGT